MVPMYGGMVFACVILIMSLSRTFRLTEEADVPMSPVVIRTGGQPGWGLIEIWREVHICPLSK